MGAVIRRGFVSFHSRTERRNGRKTRQQVSSLSNPAATHNFSLPSEMPRPDAVLGDGLHEAMDHRPVFGGAGPRCLLNGNASHDLKRETEDDDASYGPSASVCQCRSTLAAEQ